MPPYFYDITRDNSLLMVRPHHGKYRVENMVRVVKIPPGLHDSAGIDTPGVFDRALGNVFRIEAMNERGHLELVVAGRNPSQSTYQSDTLWIEPEFVEPVSIHFHPI
jgi:hypothetical protein